MALKIVLDCRNRIETYIQFHPEFATSLVPVKNLFPVPPIITDMLEAGRMAQVGPMAAVAGAVAQFCGAALLNHTREVIVENGGDIFVKSDSETVFSIYAKNSPFSMTTGIRIEKRDKPYGLCTSSGTFGHSKSFGKTDATTILSDSCALADALPQVGNMVLGRDIKKPLMREISSRGPGDCDYYRRKHWVMGDLKPSFPCNLNQYNLPTFFSTTIHRSRSSFTSNVFGQKPVFFITHLAPDDFAAGFPLLYIGKINGLGCAQKFNGNDIFHIGHNFPAFTGGDSAHGHVVFLVG
jgi:hypothetical protein